MVPRSADKTGLRPSGEPDQNRRTRAGNLIKLGISKTTAVKTGCARKGAWQISQDKWVMIALPKSHFKLRGLVIPWCIPQSLGGGGT